MKDGRPKYDPTQPDPEVVAIDVEGWWQLQRHLRDWTRTPETSPHVLIGAYGPIKQRFIIGSYEIAVDQWVWKERGLVKVPLLDRTNHDAADLRGRRIAGLRFGRAKWEHYVLVDRLGNVAWPPGGGATE